VLASVLLTALLAAVLLRDAQAASAPGTEQRLLTFGGAGTAQIAPDSATIQAGVSGTGSSADDALDEASSKMSGLIAHLKRQGVTSKELQTSEVSSYEDWERKGQYRASQSLTIQLDDPAGAGKLLAEATEGGADSVGGPAFAAEDQRAGYDEALRRAVADARAKADAAAAQMDARVVAVFAISEQGESPGPLYARATAADAGGAAEAVPIEEGTQTVSLSVQVSFTYSR